MRLSDLPVFLNIPCSKPSTFNVLHLLYSLKRGHSYLGVYALALALKFPEQRDTTKSRRLRTADIPRNAPLGEQQRVRRERLQVLERAQPVAVHLRGVQVGRRAGETGRPGG